jgi:hypothetical protein
MNLKSQGYKILKPTCSAKERGYKFRMEVYPKYTFPEENKKFWKELICLLSLHYFKMSFALKPAFAPT